MNDAERLRHDPAIRWIVGGTAAHSNAASPSQMGRFETQWLAAPANLSALADLSGQWIELVQGPPPPARYRARHGFKRKPDAVPSLSLNFGGLLYLFAAEGRGNSAMGCTRFLLALCVVVAHTQGSKIFDFAPMSAVTAVQAFYVISGFLITMVLNEHSGYTSLRTFYLNRYLRLWPCYAAIAALTLIFFMPLISTSLWTLDIKAAALVLFSNLTLFLQDWTLFFELHNGHLVPTANFGAGPQPWLTEFLVVPQAWTLGVELVFNVIAPFFCRRWYTMFALFLGGFAVRLAIGMWHPPAMDPWLYRFAPAEMMLFGAGGLSYFIGRTLLNLLPAWATSTAAVLCGVAIISLTLANEYTTPLVQARFGWFAPSLWLTNAPILLFIAVACPILFSATKQSAIDRFIGELSYPMYISHVSC